MSQSIWGPGFGHPQEETVRKAVVDGLIRQTLATLSPAGFRDMAKGSTDLLNELSGRGPYNRLRNYIQNPPEDLSGSHQYRIPFTQKQFGIPEPLDWGLGVVSETVNTGLSVAAAATGVGALAQGSRPLLRKGAEALTGPPLIGGLQGEVGQIFGATTKQKRLIHDTRVNIRRNMPPKPKHSDPTKAAAADLLENGVFYSGRKEGVYMKGGETYAGWRDKVARTPNAGVRGKDVPKGNMGEPTGMSMTNSPEVITHDFTPFLDRHPQGRTEGLEVAKYGIRNLINKLGNSPKGQRVREIWAAGNKKRPFMDVAHEIEPGLANHLDFLQVKLHSVSFRQNHPPIARVQVLPVPGVRWEDQIIDETTLEGMQLMQKAYLGSMNHMLKNPEVRKGLRTYADDALTAVDMGAIKPWTAMKEAWELTLMDTGDTWNEFNGYITKQLTDQGKIGALFHPDRGYPYMSHVGHGERELKIFDPGRVMHIDLREQYDPAIARMWEEEGFMSGTEHLQEAGIPEREIRRAGSGRAARLQAARDTTVVDDEGVESLSYAYGQIDMNKETLRRIRPYLTQKEQQELERLIFSMPAKP